MNRSEKTRKDQVLQRLQREQGAWVDGTDLASAEIGGSEGLKRLRELRLEGHSIEMRKHPDPERAIWQYRLAQPETKPPRPAESLKGLRFDQVKVCDRCSGKKYIVEHAATKGLKRTVCPRCQGVGVIRI